MRYRMDECCCLLFLFLLQTTHVSRYDPNSSSTFKKVACNSNVCTSSGVSNTCAANGNCPYSIQYQSPARTEGYLVEDLLYLIPQKGGAATASNIVFGCVNKHVTSHFCRCYVCGHFPTPQTIVAIRSNWELCIYLAIVNHEDCCCFEFQDWSWGAKLIVRTITFLLKRSHRFESWWC